MSLFTKRRKVAHIKREERLNKLDAGFKKAEKSMQKMITVMEAIQKDHPEYEDLNADDKMKIYMEYYKNIK